MSTEEVPERFTAVTDFGNFYVRLQNGYISIGASEDCLQIYYSFTTNKANLEWLGSERGGCEIDGKPIKREGTVQMADLGFTILKKYFPDVDPMVTLIDSSHFTCVLPDGKPHQLSKQKFYLLLFGKTYYQDAFGAVPTYESGLKAYQNFVNNMDDPAKKPLVFDFRHSFLNEQISVMYKSKPTWRSFFDTILDKFGYKKLCTIMAPWYLYALGTICEGREITSNWSIDVSKRPNILFETQGVEKGIRGTRKNLYVYNPDPFAGGRYGRRVRTYEIPYTKEYMARKRTNTRTRRSHRSRK